MADSPAMSSSVRLRLLVSFAMLPVFDALLGYLAFPLVFRLGDQGTALLVDERQAARAFGLFAGMLGLLVTVAGAIPVVFWLMRRGRLSLAQLLIAGLILGNAPFAVYLAVSIAAAVTHVLMGTISEHLAPVSALIAGGLRVITIGSAFGTASAALFWLTGVSGLSNSQLTSAAPVSRTPHCQ